MLHLLILFISLSVVSYFGYKRIKKIQLINNIPGPKSHPIFGNSLDLQGSESDKFKTISGTFCDYGDAISRVWFGSKPRCYIFKATVAEQLLKSSIHIYKGQAYDYAFPWLGKGILTSAGARWKQRRKLLTPAFHFQVLGDFFEVFNRQTKTFVEKLKSKTNGEPFDLLEDITLCALDSLLETITGRNLNTQEKNLESQYLQALTVIQDIIMKRTMVPWIQPNFMFKLLGYKKIQDETLKILNGFTDETIRLKREEQRRLAKENGSSSPQQKTNSQGTKKRLSFLDILLENYDNKTVADLDIREEVNTLLFGGHDTTSTAVFWTIYLLGCNKEIQEKVIQEMDAIFGGSDRFATMDDLREMTYLECCFKESLRILPAVPAVARLVQEDVVLGGHQIPAGTIVSVMIYRLHRDPEQFPDPEVFKPERFFPENNSSRHPYAYIPFSAGPRNCIGQKFALMEAKVFLSAFYRTYRAESTVPIEDLKLTKGFVLKSENKKIVKIFKRK